MTRVRTHNCNPFRGVRRVMRLVKFIVDLVVSFSIGMTMMIRLSMMAMRAMGMAMMDAMSVRIIVAPYR